jgi:hypothetical protein
MLSRTHDSGLCCASRAACPSERSGRTFCFGRGICSRTSMIGHHSLNPVESGVDPGVWLRLRIGGSTLAQCGGNNRTQIRSIRRNKRENRHHAPWHRLCRSIPRPTGEIDYFQAFAGRVAPFGLHPFPGGFKLNAGHARARLASLPINTSRRWPLR